MPLFLGGNKLTDIQAKQYAKKIGVNIKWIYKFMYEWNETTRYLTDNIEWVKEGGRNIWKEKLRQQK